MEKRYMKRRKSRFGRVVAVVVAAAAFVAITALPSMANNISMGPQAMEGDLKLSPGNALEGGFDFKIQNGVGGTVSFVGAKLTFANISCDNGATPTQTTIVLDMGSPTYTVPVGNSDWQPSGDQHNSSTLQSGIFVIPDICSGGKVRLNHGATFTADLQSSNLSADIHVRWHYIGCFTSSCTSGSWSGTGDFQPDVLIPVGTVGLLGLAVVLGLGLFVQQRRSLARRRSKTQAAA
jgi:hypothetical protein